MPGSLPRRLFLPVPHCRAGKGSTQPSSVVICWATPVAENSAWEAAKARALWVRGQAALLLHVDWGVQSVGGGWGGEEEELRAVWSCSLACHQARHFRCVVSLHPYTTLWCTCYCYVFPYNRWRNCPLCLKQSFQGLLNTSGVCWMVRAPAVFIAILWAMLGTVSRSGKVTGKKGIGKTLVWMKQQGNSLMVQWLGLCTFNCAFTPWLEH